VRFARVRAAAKQIPREWIAGQSGNGLNGSLGGSTPLRGVLHHCPRRTCGLLRFSDRQRLDAWRPGVLSGALANMIRGRIPDRLQAPV
jgi:hypothetical protein